MGRHDPANPLPPCPFRLNWASDGTTVYELRNSTIPELASTLGNYPSINDLVVDRTGLTGRFDITVRSYEARETGSGPPPVGGPPVPPTDVALRQQLGLRLQRARLPVEVIVIDAVVRPSAN